MVTRNRKSGSFAVLFAIAGLVFLAAGKRCRRSATGTTPDAAGTPCARA